MKISIDIGNGYVKAINENEEKLHFPTVLKQNNDKNILGFTQNDYSININGTGFYVGDLALAKRASRQWQSNKTVNTDTEIYVSLCSHLLTQDEAPEIDTLCLGLPYSYYIELDGGELLKKELSGKTIKTIYKDQEKNIKINKVSVYPQGVGSYFSNLYHISGQPKDGAEKLIKSLFLDIGYRTVDVVAFESINNNFELIQENSFSLEEFGMFQVANYIKDRLDIEFSSNEIEYALQNNNSILETMYGEHDISKLAQEGYIELAKKITTEINVKLSGEIQKYKNIFLSGGGAMNLHSQIKKTYPNIQVQEDFVFGNARGYLALENTK